MNSGLIASRYSKALLEFATSAGDAETVCRQAGLILRAFADVPGFRSAITDHAAVNVEQKTELLHTALGGESASESLERLFALVGKNGRMPEMQFILKSYIDLYRKSRNMHIARLLTAVPVDDSFRARICRKLSDALGGEITLKEEVDPAIIGGFVLSVDGCRADASISGQLEALRSEYLKHNKRMI